MPSNSNIVQIQRKNEGADADLLPLVLIHDSGGTLFSYYCLGNLASDVYGISNPHFSSGRPWKGGVRQMAKLYAKFIRSVIPNGKILLGGK